MKLLKRTQFGNPILREVAKRLTPEEIKSDAIQQLIADMQYTVSKRPYGVGLAAPQVGKGVALSIIGIKPTPSRLERKNVDMVIINPEITKTYGRRTQLWEGCISFGGTKDFPYAKVPRYKKIRLKYLDEHAQEHEADFEGILAHVLQHETDHLNGILFVDRVKDTKTYVTISEYKRRFLGTK